MNRVLARQLRRLGLDSQRPPSDVAAWTRFLERVETTYEEADRSRYLLERSMEISSREMEQVNRDIRKLAEREMERQQLLARHDFHQLPVAAWLEDFRGAAQRLDDLRESVVEDLNRYLDDNPEALRDLIGRVVVIDCNPMVEALVGLDRDQLLGPIDAGVLSEESMASWRDQFVALWNGSNTVEVEFTGQRGDGSPFSAILHWSVASIDDEPDYSRVMAVIIDISGRIEAEEQIRQLVVAKDEFLASVSHELRTPLTSVLGYADLLLEFELEDAAMVEMLETVSDQAVDLSNIVDDLLVVARMDLGQLDVDLVPVELSSVVDGCLRSFSRVHRVGDSLEGVHAIADSGRVRQILRNLLTNAERYGGDEIVVHSSLVDYDMVEIAVCDSGPVLEAGLSGQVFDRYYRETGERRPTGSVGLGLTIARDLAQLMGGELSYRHEGTWSEFVLTLPRAVRQLRAVG